MDIGLVDPEIRRIVARLGSIQLQRPEVRLLARAMYAVMPAARTPGTIVERVHEADIVARIVRPVEARRSIGAVLWFHGGGFVIGTTKQDAALLGRASAELGIPTCSVRYPLAPRARIDEMLEVAYRAWTWFVAHAEECGVRADRIVIGGESAGAQLASVLAQCIRDRGGVQPAGVWLFGPATDDRIAASRPEEARRPGSHFIIDRRTYLALMPLFAGRPAGTADMPPYTFANRREDLAGLPPHWIYVGSIELFREEAAAYAERLRRAGVPTEFVVVDGAVHGFELLEPRSALAQGLFDQAIAWLRTRVSQGVSRVSPP